MARVTEPLASSSLKVLSFESTLYILMDGRWRYHERDKSHLGGSAYTGNCFVSFLTHSRGVGYDTDIFTDDSAVHAHVNFRIRAESHILSHLLSLEIYLTRII